MNEELILAIFRVVLSVVVGGYILIMMVYELWMDYERLKRGGK